MKRVIELIEKEVEEINTGRKLIGRNADYANAAVYGLERAIELIKASAALEVWEGSIMHKLNLENGTIEKEYALIGMSKVENGYAATCCEFGDEKDGNTQFQAMVDIQDADQLFAYVSSDWGVTKRKALIACKGFTETGRPISPTMIDYQEQ